MATTIDPIPGATVPTVTDEELFAGKGTLGPCTYRELHADHSASPPSTCPSPFYVLIVTGAGVFRFQDGSLMTVNMTAGSICKDPTTGLGALTETYQITGGTGRFQSASGTLTLTGTLNVVLSDTDGIPKLLTNIGKFEGTVLGVASEGQQQD